MGWEVWKRCGISFPGIEATVWEADSCNIVVIETLGLLNMHLTQRPRSNQPWLRVPSALVDIKTNSSGA